MREKDAILAWDFKSASPRQTRHIVLGSIRESSSIVSNLVPCLDFFQSEHSVFYLGSSTRTRS